MDLHEREWFIQAPWGRICIVAWGSCLDTPVLLCHGENDSMASFRPLLRLLPKNFYYVGMEMPGNGRSDHFPHGLPVNVLDMVYPIEVVRRHFRWDHFIYISHSLACTIGRLYNMAYPGRMTKVVELDPLTASFPVDLDMYAHWYERYYNDYFKKYEQFNSPKEIGPKYTWNEAIQKVVNMRGLTPETARATIERFSEPAGTNDKGEELIRFTFDQRIKRMPRFPVTSGYLQAAYTKMTNPYLIIAVDSSIQYEMYKKTPFMLDENAFNGNVRVRTVKGRHDEHVIHPEVVAPYVSQFLLHGVDGLENKAKL